MLKIRKTICSKDFFTLLLLLFWGRDHLLGYAETVMKKIPLVNIVAQWVIPFIVVVCIAAALPYMVKSISYKDVIFVLCVGLAYCLNLLIYKSTHKYLREIGTALWTTVLPVYFIGLCMDVKESGKMLYRLSMLNVWLLMFVSLVLGDPMSDTRSLYEGAMGRAYNMLPQVLVICIFVFEKPNVWNISTLVVSSIYLFTCGTRGAVLCLFVFIIAYVLFRKPVKKHIALYCVVLLVMAVILIFYRPILLGLKFIAVELGMSDRTINKMLSGAFFTSTGRDTLKNVVVKGILARPVLGYGIAGDRTLVGIYVHNLALEFLASYGVILGSILLMALAVVIIMGYRKAQNSETKAFILMLCCAVILKLFMSSTYLQEELFFLLLGLCIRQIRNAGGLWGGLFRLRSNRLGDTV